MSKKLCMMKTVLVIIAVFVLFVVPFTTEAESDDEQQKLEYDVNVRAQVIPIYAVNEKGEPVFDLKEEEIEFFVDGKPGTIALFSSPYNEKGEKRSEITQIKQDGSRVEIKTPDRINFIVIDLVSNNAKGINYSKKIVEGIINQCPQSDRFVIMESSFNHGFKLLAGPDNDKKKLIASLKNLDRFSTDRTFTPSEMINRLGLFGAGDNDYAGRALVLETAVATGKSDAMFYQRVVANHLNTVSQLKYIFQSISQPKHVYIISGGISTSFFTMGEKKNLYFNFLGSAAQAINEGGSALTVIDPIPGQTKEFTESLKHMAVQGGGIFIGEHGDFKEIIAAAKKTTQAYYELAFYPGEEKNMKIDVKCKRKGVSLQTVKHAEKGKPYLEMASLQKEIFASNVINGGSWSRIIGKVQKVDLKQIKKQEPGEENSKFKYKYVRVSIPEKMKGLDVDVFVINQNPETMKSNIIKTTQNAGVMLEVKVPVEKGMLQFVVIVEPQTTQCVYNEV